MSYGGHVLDMITRLKQGREMKDLRRQRQKSKQTYLNGKPTGMPKVTVEQMNEISRRTKEREQQQTTYFVKMTLIIMGVLLGVVLVLWWVLKLDAI